MKKNLRFIRLLFQLKLQRQMTYRLSFFSATFVDGTLFLFWLFMFQAIYSKVDTIGGWSLGQTIIFLGTFSLLNAINMTLYFFGVNGIPQKIMDGEFDHYLTKPMNPLLRLTFENVNVGSFPLIPLSVGIVLYGLSLANVQVHAGTISLYVFFILIMAILYYDMEVIIRTFPFFFLSAGNIERIEESAFDLCMRIPGVLFHGAFKALFYIILPYGIMATVPTQVLTKSASARTMLFSVGIVVVFTIFTQWFWRFGTKRYKSTSS